MVIFAVNSLLYLNQSVPPYGVALNSLTSGTTAFPLREWGGPQGCGKGVGGRCLGPGQQVLSTVSTGTQDGVRITLDCAQAAFISYDKLVVSLKGGEM